MVANPARGQLNRENDFFPSRFAPESLVSREGFGRPVLHQPTHKHRRVSVVHNTLLCESVHQGRQVVQLRGTQDNGRTSEVSRVSRVFKKTGVS